VNHFHILVTLYPNVLLKQQTVMKKYVAEMIGTMVLVLMGCGAAVFAGAGQPFDSVGTLGVAFAFGLSVVAMAYAIGSISGCHINPAITLGLFLTGRMNGKDTVMYVIFQVIGAMIGSAILWFLAKDSGSTTTLTGANGFVEGAMMPAFVAETVFTFIFVLVVLGVTAKNGLNQFAGLAIGLALVLVHIVCIPITGTSVNPARSIGPALFEGGTALSQLWLFIVAPFLGAAIAAIAWRGITVEPKNETA
jgi:aquaporin Z